MSGVARVLAAILLLGFTAYSDSRVTGTVILAPIEGGCWTIHGDDKVVYEPLNLPPEFQQSGLRVIVTLRPSPMATVCMAGKPVEVVDIRHE